MHYCFRIKRYRGKVDNVMFKHAQLETVKAWIIDPANGSLPLHERIQRAIRTDTGRDIITVRPFLLHVLWRLLSAFPGYH
jgi:hypothetical protein